MFRMLGALFVFDAFKRHEGGIWVWVLGALIVMFLQGTFGFVTWLSKLLNAN